MMPQQLMEGSQRELRDDGFSCELQGLLVLCFYHIYIYAHIYIYIDRYLTLYGSSWYRYIISKLEIFALCFMQCGLIFDIYVAQKKALIEQQHGRTCEVGELLRNQLGCAG